MIGNSLTFYSAIVTGEARMSRAIVLDNCRVFGMAKWFCADIPSCPCSAH